MRPSARICSPTWSFCSVQPAARVPTLNVVRSLALAACAAVLLTPPALGASVENVIRISDALVFLRKAPVSDLPQPVRVCR